MKGRLVSAAALFLIVSAALALDRAFAVRWFAAALMASVLALGAVECQTLLGRWARRRSPGVPPTRLGAAGRALFAVGIIGFPGALLLALGLRENGLLLVLYVIAVAKMTDNGALLVGSLWGRHALAPAISPAKTVEGVWGGLAAGVLTSVLLGPWCGVCGVMRGLLAGAGVSALAVLGDLAESWLKRKAGVKDSGALLPGIGGVLDLVDSVLLSAPAAYAMFSVTALP